MGADDASGHRAVFLDRDGVINENVFNPATGEMESPLTAGQFRFLPGALEAMFAFRRAGFLLFLVSNQPNHAKGKASLAELHAIHERMQAELERSGIDFVEFYYCFHHPAGITQGYSGPCECRKPSPYFLEKAIAEYGIDRESSWMVGDRWSDIACGRDAGVAAILIAESPVEFAEVPVARDLRHASQIILRTERGRKIR
ncbi:D-glycero-alpha-D-manno-heptose-1,7-bisphosphate 7-phosphatase [Silvibacterium acidisoli]|uniref:D-glycero-alpha-D-manno-heptose-1,7-bisphosphate 7-phosphatase n=1 Tax=Acidobacteriaceae bacterium ZG23-2 TaxID=2883246 RepID=UPI00406C81DA